MGKALFRKCRDRDLEHLAIMEAVMGTMTDTFARKAAERKKKWFRSNNQLDWPQAGTSREIEKDVKATKSLDVSASGSRP